VKVKFSYNKHKIFNNSIKYLKEVLNSDFITQGPVTKKFENKLKKITKSKYCLTFNSASSALLAACKSLKLKQGDYFWTVPNTYLATANAGLLCQANIDLVDIDKDTLNICPKKLEEKLKKTKKKNLPKIILAVHFAGCSHDQKKIFRLSKKFHFKIIEDCSHSFGGKYDKYNVGECKYSDIAVTSFHPLKTITTGEGGALFTNNTNINKFCISLRENGKIRYKKLKFKDNIFKQYDHIMPGYNFRLSDLNCALGISQLENFKKIILKRNLLAKNYKKLLKEIPINFQKIPTNIKSTYHLFIVTIVDKKMQKKFKEIFIKLKERGVGITLHYHPLHYHSLFKKIGFRKNDYPISEFYAKYSFSLPIYYDLTYKDQKKIVEELKRIIY
jgi:dTDP-4-amino-4,6-dideoxygalactose transaminase